MIRITDDPNALIPAFGAIMQALGYFKPEDSPEKFREVATLAADSLQMPCLLGLTEATLELTAQQLSYFVGLFPAARKVFANSDDPTILADFERAILPYTEAYNENLGLSQEN